jgi:hypothetical protein
VYQALIDDEFETDVPSLQGEMTITIELADADGGTEVTGVHERLPLEGDP